MAVTTGLWLVAIAGCVERGAEQEGRAPSPDAGVLAAYDVAFPNGERARVTFTSAGIHPKLPPLESTHPVIVQGVHVEGRDLEPLHVLLAEGVPMASTPNHPAENVPKRYSLGFFTGEDRGPRFAQWALLPQIMAHPARAALFPSHEATWGAGAGSDSVGGTWQLEFPEGMLAFRAVSDGRPWASEVVVEASCAGTDGCPASFRMIRQGGTLDLPMEGTLPVSVYGLVASGVISSPAIPHYRPNPVLGNVEEAIDFGRGRSPELDAYLRDHPSWLVLEAAFEDNPPLTGAWRILLGSPVTSEAHRIEVLMVPGGTLTWGLVASVNVVLTRPPLLPAQWFPPVLEARLASPGWSCGSSSLSAIRVIEYRVGGWADGGLAAPGAGTLLIQDVAAAPSCAWDAWIQVWGLGHPRPMAVAYACGAGPTPIEVTCPKG